MDLSSLSSYYNSALTDASSVTSNKLSGLADKDMSNATDDELMDVCKEFESYFMEQIFKEMQKTVSIMGDEDSANSQLVDFYKDSTIAKLAQESTDQNSLGLAQTLYEQMKRNYNL